MRAPEFWNSDGVPARLLDPIGKLYGLAGTLRRRWATQSKARIPVICVGNLTVGGTGKTPTAMAVAQQLLDQGHCPHFLTRGYGGRERGPILVSPETHEALDVGDEPLLLARMAPTWVCSDRVTGATLAAQAGATHLIMDDGLQNPYLAKDLTFIVIDGATGFGNERLVPAGPLRESIDQALSRIDAAIVIGTDQAGIQERLPAGLLTLTANLQPSADARRFSGARVLAFAGIGRPEKFYETLDSIGADLVETRSFPDHHRFNALEIDAILERARQFDAACVTTEKDHVRLPLNLKNTVEKLAISVAFKEPDRLRNLLLHLPSSHAADAK
ncbi:MAG: tetraacyldisaccharide 4'-kinase [Pseudomonadota bacterium]